jgi:arylsulfatase A-like enzyme
MAKEARAEGARATRWTIPLEAVPPGAEELGRAIVLGGLLHVVADGVAIVATLPLDSSTPAHLFFAALEGLGLAGAMAAPLFAWARFRRGGWGVLAVYLALAVVAMEGVLGTQLRRQAAAVLDGQLRPVLLPLYVVLCGSAVVAAHLLGAAAGRMGRLVSITVGLALGGIVVGHAIHRDDYPGLHLAIFWVASILGGASLAPRLERWRLLAWAWLAGGAVALAAWLWAPPNDLRRRLFSEPGAVAPWALAQLAWRPPFSNWPPVSPPEVVPHSETTRAQSLWGLNPDPVIVLLSIDALRADVVFSGRFDDDLPQLSALRDQSAAFTRATAPGSQTSVTLTSLFAGRYFSQLSWDYYGTGRTRFHYAAQDATPRFVERLTAAGVDTQSFLGLTFLAGQFGVARGFETEHRLVEGRRHGAVSELMPPLIEAVQAHRAGPAFFFTHLMEPHEPYDRGRRKTGPAFERYVSEIHVVDRWISRLLRALRRRHPRRGYLILTADHGEAFGEHGTKFHTKTLYEELISVPLLFFGPGIPARRIDRRVSLMDVGPTVTHLCGLSRGSGQMGVSLVPLARGLSSEAMRPILAEGRLRRAMLRGRLKVIEDTRRKTVEAYDLHTDPDELHNLLQREGRADVEALRLLAKMRAFFVQVRREHPDDEPPYKP